MRRFLRSAPVVLALLGAVLAAQDKQPGNVAPYYPSPLPVVKQMLELGELKAGQLHYDLGSGDGRLVIAAARDFGARSVGYEIDPKLVDASRQQIADSWRNPPGSPDDVLDRLERAGLSVSVAELRTVA